MAVLMTSPFLQFFDDDGAPLAGGKVHTYTATGTFATNKATFTTEAGDVEQANPVLLDSAGRVTIWLEGTYDFVVKDSTDVTIETTLDVTAFTTLPATSDSYFESFSGTGAQTAFTTSDDLGTDEKAIYVWVDAGAGDAEGYDIQNPSAYTIAGTTLTFSVAPASGTNNIFVSAPSLLVGAASSSAADAATSAAAAAASETAAAASAAQLIGTSTTSLAITVASKAFTTQASKFFDVGTWLLITSDADETNYMHGQVTAYSGTSLTVNVTNIGGSGTLADWTIRVAGTQGAKGDTGSISDLSGVAAGTPTLTDKLIWDDVDDSNATKSATIADVLALAASGWATQRIVTLSSDASIEFEDGVSGVDTTIVGEYRVVIQNVTVDVDDRNLQMEVSVDGGSTKITGRYHHVLTNENGTYAETFSSSATLLRLINGIGNATGEHGSCIITLGNLNATTHKTFKSTGTCVNQANDLQLADSSLFAPTASAIDSITISTNSTSMVAGKLIFQVREF